jgi:hypothetical protein
MVFRYQKQDGVASASRAVAAAKQPNLSVTVLGQEIWIWITFWPVRVNIAKTGPKLSEGVPSIARQDRPKDCKTLSILVANWS